MKSPESSRAMGRPVTAGGRSDLAARVETRCSALSRALPLLPDMKTKREKWIKDWPGQMSLTRPGRVDGRVHEGAARVSEPEERDAQAKKQARCSPACDMVRGLDKLSARRWSTSSPSRCARRHRPDGQAGARRSATSSGCGWHLLGGAKVHRRRPTDQPVRLRVHGGDRPARHHAAHRPLLHDADDGAAPAPRRAAAGPRGHGQDGDGQGFEQESGQAVHRVQLQRRSRLQVARKDVLGAGADGRVELLRRVQPDRGGGAERGGAANPFDIDRGHPAEGHVPLRGARDQARLDVRHLRHDEPRLRGPLRAAREPQGAAAADGGDEARHASSSSEIMSSREKPRPQEALSQKTDDDSTT